MLLTIVRYGNPILRQKGKRIAAVTPEIKTLAKNMLETMRHAKGIGLAAQQVGQALQLAVIDITGIKERPSQLWLQQKPADPESIMPLILINPEISGTKTKVVGYEGCLSFPGIGADISRSQRVHVRAQTFNNTIIEFDASGLLGRAIQHEYDHLQGKLFIDYLAADERKTLKPELEKIRIETETFLASQAAS
jgi:peptide deformylase